LFAVRNPSTPPQGLIFFDHPFLTLEDR